MLGAVGGDRHDHSGFASARAIVPMRRRPLRLPGYDYSRPGSYFVTICVQDRHCLFGEVLAGELRLNASGRMIREAWTTIMRCDAAAAPHALVVMPNHVHGVVTLADADADLERAGTEARPYALSDAVRRFKSWTTRRYVDGVHAGGWPRFSGRLWQRGYFDHVIRGDEDLIRVLEYIESNPARWALDRENPARVHPAPLDP
jgi:REP element-mobilizing transposase RayT